MASERLTAKERSRLARELPEGMDPMEASIALDELAEAWLAAEEMIMGEEG